MNITAVVGEHYRLRMNDPVTEEEFWVPVTVHARIRTVLPLYTGLPDEYLVTISDDEGKVPGRFNVPEFVLEA